MKLKRFNKSNLPTRIGSNVTVIRLSNSSGDIVFPKQTVAILGMKATDKVEFLQNGEAPKEWFFTKNESEDALPLKQNSSQAGLKMQNMTMVTTILRELGITETSVTFRVSKEPLEVDGEMLYPILTSSYKEFLKTK